MESFDDKFKPEMPPGGASDMELALFLAEHIDNPCETEMASGKKENIREFYLRKAKNALSKFTDEHAKRFLELEIKKYE